MSAIRSFIERYDIGKGIVSGYLSVFLSMLCFAGVLCFRFPEQLTTPEFREIYTGESMKWLLTGTLIASMLFGLFNVLFSSSKKTGISGILVACITIVLGGFDVQGRAVEKTNWYLGLDWLILDLFIMAVIFLPIEMVFPKRAHQNRFHEEWRTDLIYFAIGHLLIQFFGVIVQKPASLFFGKMDLGELQGFVRSLPFAVELFAAFLITDLFQYWIHRLFHNSRYLWRFHAVHHSVREMDWLAGSRMHFVDVVLTRSFTYIPLYVCGFSPLVFNAYIIVIAIHAVYIHSNTRLNPGILKYVITTPQYHHWHHCIEKEYYGKNYAVFFPFIDMIFGTYHLPASKWPEGTGLNEAHFPKGYLGQFIYPFLNDPLNSEMDPEKESTR